MSLIKCPECGQTISDQADCCIHCGYPLKKPEKPKVVITFVANKNPLVAVPLYIFLDGEQVGTITATTTGSHIILLAGADIINSQKIVIPDNVRQTTINIVLRSHIVGLIAAREDTQWEIDYSDNSYDDGRGGVVKCVEELEIRKALDAGDKSKALQWAEKARNNGNISEESYYHWLDEIGK